MEQINYYYHIYVQYADGLAKEEAYVSDITDKDVVIKNYVNPFINKSEMLIVSGRIIKYNNIKIFRVLESKTKLGDIVDNMNNSVTSGVFSFYSARSILKDGNENLKDITLDLIKL